MRLRATVMGAAEHRFALLPEARVQQPIAWWGGELIRADRLLREAQAIADRLPPRAFVINLCGNRYHFLLLLVAALLRGQVSLLPPNRTAAAMRALADDYPDSYVASDDEQLPDSGNAVVHIGRPVLTPRTAHNPVLNGDQLVAVVFTSGSTGKAQAHLKTWDIFRRSVDLIAAHLGLAAAPGHCTVATVPAQHMYGLETTVLLPLRSGCVLTDQRAFYPADVQSALLALPRPRLLVTTPIHLRACLDSTGDLAPVDLIVSATAPLSAALARSAEERFGAELVEIYGCTEAGSVATRRTSREDRWTLFSGLSLQAEGDFSLLSAPYLDRPVVLQDHLRHERDGRFSWLGRHSDHISVAGKRTSLGALNAALSSIPGVEDGVFFMPDAVASEAAVGRLLAFAVAPGHSPETLLAELRQRIDPVFLPRPLFVVDALPRQEHGKLSRDALQALLHACRNRR